MRKLVGKVRHAFLAGAGKINASGAQVGGAGSVIHRPENCRAAVLLPTAALTIHDEDGNPVEVAFEQEVMVAMPCINQEEAHALAVRLTESKEAKSALVVSIVESHFGMEGTLAPGRTLEDARDTIG